MASLGEQLASMMRASVSTIHAQPHSKNLSLDMLADTVHDIVVGPVKMQNPTNVRRDVLEASRSLARRVALESAMERGALADKHPELARAAAAGAPALTQEAVERLNAAAAAEGKTKGKGSLAEHLQGVVSGGTKPDIASRQSIQDKNVSYILSSSSTRANEVARLKKNVEALANMIPKTQRESAQESRVEIGARERIREEEKEAKRQKALEGDRSHAPPGPGQGKSHEAAKRKAQKERLEQAKAAMEARKAAEHHEVRRRWMGSAYHSITGQELTEEEYGASFGHMSDDELADSMARAAVAKHSGYREYGQSYLGRAARILEVDAQGRPLDLHVARGKRQSAEAQIRAWQQEGRDAIPFMSMLAHQWAAMRPPTGMAAERYANGRGRGKGGGLPWWTNSDPILNLLERYGQAGPGMIPTEPYQKMYDALGGDAMSNAQRLLLRPGIEADYRTGIGAPVGLPDPSVWAERAKIANKAMLRHHANGRVQPRSKSGQFGSGSVEWTPDEILEVIKQGILQRYMASMKNKGGASTGALLSALVSMTGEIVRSADRTTYNVAFELPDRQRPSRWKYDRTASVRYYGPRVFQGRPPIIAKSRTKPMRYFISGEKHETFTVAGFEGYDSVFEVTEQDMIHGQQVLAKAFEGFVENTVFGSG